MPQSNNHRPRKSKMIPVDYDPVRRFVAAYVLQATVDYFYPPQDLEPEYHQSAIEFIHSSDGQELIAQFNIPMPKIQSTLQRAA